MCCQVLANDTMKPRELHGSRDLFVVGLSGPVWFRMACWSLGGMVYKSTQHFGIGGAIALESTLCQCCRCVVGVQDLLPTEAHPSRPLALEPPGIGWSVLGSVVAAQ